MLQNMLFMNFQMAQHYKYSITEMENMMPFERHIYISLLEAYLESQKKDAG